MKRLLFTMLALAFAVGCGQNQGAGPGSDAETDANRDAVRERLASGRYSVAVIPKGLVHQFWLTVKAGAEAAGREHGAAVLWKGPNAETDIEEQINIIDDMISRGVDAIVMAATDRTALVDVVRRATEAKIPVVTIDSGVDSELPVSFIATDNEKGAEMAADELARLIGNKGKVGLIPFVIGAATSDQRETGFRRGLEKYPDITLGPVQPSNSKEDVAVSVTEDMMQAHPDLAGIFAANESSAVGAAQAIRAAGKAGQIKLVAFDAAEEEIAALKEGVIQALIVQNPYQMGYQGVKAAVDTLKGQPVEKRIDTGVKVVTAESLETPEVQALLNPTPPEDAGPIIPPNPATDPASREAAPAAQ
jgi:ribose transport system substrate-binding protein